MLYHSSSHKVLKKNSPPKPRNSFIANHSKETGYSTNRNPYDISPLNSPSKRYLFSVDMNSNMINKDNSDLDTQKDSTSHNFTPISKGGIDGLLTNKLSKHNQLKEGSFSFNEITLDLKKKVNTFNRENSIDKLYSMLKLRKYTLNESKKISNYNKEELLLRAQGQGVFCLNCKYKTNRTPSDDRTDYNNLIQPNYQKLKRLIKQRAVNILFKNRLSNEQQVIKRDISQSSMKDVGVSANFPLISPKKKHIINIKVTPKKDSFNSNRPRDREIIMALRKTNQEHLKRRIVYFNHELNKII